ncbi:methyltransferase domain-containing protein [Streptomyces millisiae]|uniref:Protein-L-isoaspartate O-methyltransferase n=1 Tax=Streptomyces millisiae TaxID=3075542 RepID=A0ABU2LWJ1_9ACTN|nr:methyltransferase domain-containing protein [Streptomyces sp. DSM 44918]MDT0321905.1 methyltransferase domain-containing protein [Streptomyces sp. DSM 44918]
MSVSNIPARWGELDSAMAESGCWPARSPWIREAAASLLRHDFAADQLWYWDGYGYQPVDRGRDADGWAAQVYAGPHDAAITQITDGRPSSSLSAPAVVADMLDSLLLEPGHRVLELGAGTGWNAALLAHRVGPGLVISVEVDDALAATARTRLERAGVKAEVEVGDGAAGWPAEAPYDRIIATYAVEEVPWAWVEQTVPGGRIVTPWGRLGHVALTVAADGRSASGWIQGLAQFMPARGSARFRTWQEVRGDGPAEHERPLTRDLAPLHDNPHLLFALRIALPTVQIITRTEGGNVTAWVHDGASSWATLDGSQSMTYSGGPHDLAADLDHAWAHWTEKGMPDLYDFGMTVREESQVIWCRDPSTGPYWPATMPSIANPR